MSHSSNQPPKDPDALKRWLKEKSKDDINAIFGKDYKPADFEESGAIFGNIEDLDKTDAERFPNELEEHTPKERRKSFRLLSNNQKNGP